MLNVVQYLVVICVHVRSFDLGCVGIYICQLVIWGTMWLLATPSQKSARYSTR